MTAIENAIVILVGISTLLATGSAAIKWMVKHYLGEIKHELKPNGGGSIKDQINRLDARSNKNEILNTETFKRVEKLEKKIDDLYDKFIDYLSK